MATSTVLKPIYERLALLPCAEANAELAETLTIRGVHATQGCWSDPDNMSFRFKRGDGSHVYFTGKEMRAATWWYWLPEQEAISIEAALFPMTRVEPRFRYIARADMAAGGKLIRGSRLSEYFEGEAARDAAYRERERLRTQWPDAALFEADSVEDAERLLSPDADDDEGFRAYRERRATERAHRLDALIQQLAPEIV